MENCEPQLTDVVKHQPTATLTGKEKNSLKNSLFRALRWCRLVFTSISVEPVLFLHGLAGIISMVVSSNMMKDRICSHYFQYTDEQCAQYGSGMNKTVDLTVQEEWVVFDMYSTVALMIPSIIISLFLGSWSDLFGRRIPLISSYIGLILSLAISLVLFSYPSLPLWLLFLPNFVLSISGGLTTLLMSVYAYIADISETGSARTLRITTVDVAMTLSVTAGSYISSVIMTSDSVPHDLNLWLSLGSAFLGLVYVLIFIKTTRTPPPTITDGESSTKTTSAWQKIRALGRIQLIVESFRCALKRRKRRTRTALWLLIAALSVSVLSYSFEMNIMLPFLTGAPLHWTTACNARFQSFFGIPNVIVLGVGTYFLRQVLKVDDVGLMLVGTISWMANSFITSIAQQTYLMYIGQIVGLASMMSMIGSRALVSGLVPRDEQGKVFSCTSVVESLVPVVGAVAANKIFAASVRWWPGMFAAIAAGLGGITLVLLIVADHIMLADNVAARRDELESCRNEAVSKNTEVQVENGNKV